MKNFVISLTHATERRAHIQRQFNAQDIPFEFFDAITPEPARQLAEKLSISVQGADLTQGEIACLMSHVCLWQKIIDENLAYAAIFEDDIHLAADAEFYLKSSNWLIDIDIVKIEKFFEKTILSPFGLRTKNSKYFLFRLLGMHLGCAGYILSKNGAISLMKFIKKYSSVIAVDVIVFEDYIKDGYYKVYQMNPSLCIQNNILFPENDIFLSSLECDRRYRLIETIKNNQEKSNFLPLSLRIKREFIMFFLRPFFKLRKKLFTKDIVFNES